MNDKKYAILVADDNPVFVKTFGLMLSNILQDKLAFMDWACNGEEAVKCFENKEYDYVFMDVDMPILDGVGATLQLSSDSVRDTTIIALTGHQEIEVMQKMIIAGARHYIVKNELDEQKLERFFKL